MNVERFAKIIDSDPLLFGGIIGACAAMVVLFVAFSIYRGATERSKERASEIKESAYMLVGREVAYKRDGAEYTGTVYSVHYELDDEAYKILLFVYVTELGRYIIIDYGRYYDKVKVVG
jgi:hypothetical protein